MVGEYTAGFVIQSIKSAFSTTNYPLKDSALLDSAATIHIFNDMDRFNRFQQAGPEDFVYAGEQRVPIRGYGNVVIHTQGPRGWGCIELFDVALCENFPCNLVSLRQLHKRGYWWDNRPGFNCLRSSSNAIVCNLVDRYDQFVIEDIPSGIRRSAFVSRRHLYNSWTKRSPRKASARKWHLRLGHPGPQALEHLVNTSRDVRIKGPTTTECDDCAVSKIKRQIRRQPRDVGHRPGERLAIDFHDLEVNSDGQSSVMLITDRWSGFIWDYYLVTRGSMEIVAALRDLVGLLERQYQVKPRVMECDNEIIGPDVRRIPGTIPLDFLRARNIIVENSAVYTPAQNGGAEVSGSIIKTKARAMRAGAKLPRYLWVEIYRCAVYLYNRTPKYIYNWRTPYDRLHTYIAHRDGIVVEDRKPYQAHLRVYGCKAFAMTPDALAGNNKRQRLNPRAWIGYLVGYQATNIYRVWNPKTGRVISTRDVIFNEDETFSGNIEQLKDDLLHISSDELNKLLDQAEEPQTDPNTTAEEDQTGASIPQDDWEGLRGEDEDVIVRLSWEDHALQEGIVDAGAEESEVVPDQPAGTENSSGNSGSAEADREIPDGTEDQLQADADDQSKNSDARSRPYPTPVSLPPSALLAMSVREGVCETHDEKFKHDPAKEPIEVWKSAFVAGCQATPIGILADKVIDKAKFHRLMKNPLNLHRRDMPSLPRSHRDLAGHPMGSLFDTAEKEHLRSHQEMQSWTEVPKGDVRARGKHIFDCMWVYVYKFDKHGRFQKCKARLVVRGDQQSKSIHEETYAATLAGRSFRTLMAIAARFDLEMIQYDAVNAFVNAKLEKDVFMRMPPGYRKFGKILELQKALYGLRESPLLWQRELTTTLQGLGFKTVAHEPCCMTKEGIIIFFYVDDIVLAYKKKRESEVQSIMNNVRKKYKLTGGEPLQWFLGIEIIRDRERRLIWLSQSDYLDKIANLADQTERRHDTPMRREELVPYAERATLASIRRYQRKVGSILYAAVITRPDVAFAASRLARFNANPGPEHHEAADQVLLYLRKTKYLALQFGGEDVFIVASDASFADNTIDRKSSQAYAMRLFGGFIGWRANKQATVTTSTTEAELLALSQAAKEAMFVSRLIKELGIKLDDERIRIQCDNQQTIQLVNKDIAKLQTKLRHVDIHNHWLRQEAQLDRISVEYRPTADMIADGLTKVLTNTSFQKFVKQIGLADVSRHLESRRLRDIREQDLIQKQEQLEADYETAPVSALTASTGGAC